MGGAVMKIVGDKIIVDLYVPGILSGGLSSIVHKEHGTLIVLEYHIVCLVKTLCL